MENNIIFMDRYESVRDNETQSIEIFTTKNIDRNVIEHVVWIYNHEGFKGIDAYLLNAEKCSQEEREHIVESLSNWNKEHEASITYDLSKINWTKLNRQKGILVNMISEWGEADDPDQREDAKEVEGILELLNDIETQFNKV